MKLLKIGALVSLFLLMVPVVLAQGAGKGPAYDPAQEITVKGTVVEIAPVDCPKGQRGTKLTLQTDELVYEVHVGPAAWLDKLQFELKAGDKVEVVGVMGPCGGKQVLKARQVTKGRVTVSLRDKRGDPLWSRTWAG